MYVCIYEWYVGRYVKMNGTRDSDDTDWVGPSVMGRIVVCARVCFYVYVCLHECVYVCMCVCMHVCMYVYMYACWLCIRCVVYVLFVCMFVCLFVCMYVCIYECMFSGVALQQHSATQCNTQTHIHTYIQRLSANKT